MKSAGQLPHLETFARAAEFSCFTAAARVLGLTQAAVSQRIHTLEQALGLALFHREGGRVLLTEAGQRLYPYAQRILGLHEEARQKVSGRKTQVGGDLTIAASSIPGEHLLPALLPAFRRRYPRVRIRVTVGDSREVHRLVEQGKAALGLVGGKKDSPHLEYRSFACDEMALIVPPTPDWKRRKRISIAELCKQPLILREAGSGSRACFEQALTQAGRTTADLDTVLELGSNEAIKEAVLRRVGCAVLSTQVVARELKAGRLHSVRVTGLPLQRDIYAVWDRRRVLPIPARLFLDGLEPCRERKPRP